LEEKLADSYKSELPETNNSSESNFHDEGMLLADSAEGKDSEGSVHGTDSGLREVFAGIPGVQNRAQSD
jgi:hypothetical protein